MFYFRIKMLDVWCEALSSLSLIFIETETLNRDLSDEVNEGNIIFIVSI